MSNKADVLIVGAGIAGLMAARELQAAGRSVIVVDKGRGVGGRMATRRIGSGRADHGAQFFTVRAPRFQDYVDKWLEEDLVYVWSRGWSDGSLGGPRADGHPRYAGRHGMTAVPKRLAQSLNVHTGVKIARLQTATAGWQATAESGTVFAGAALILTPPVPQSLALLAAGDVPLHVEDQQALAQIEYAPCLCGLFSVAGTIHLPPPSAQQRPHAPISWIADNQRKGISPDECIVTVHGSPAFSQEHFAEPEEHVMEKLLAALKPHLGEVSAVTASQYMRWRYALPVTFHTRLFKGVSGKG